MKKIFSLILIIVSLKCFGQFPMTQGMATANTRLQVNGAVDASKGLINGIYTDTTVANADFIDFYTGAQIYTTSDNNLWLRIVSTWVRIAKYSEVPASLRFAVSGEDNFFTQNRAADANFKTFGITKMLSGQLKAGTSTNYMDDNFDSTYRSILVNKGSDFYSFEANSTSKYWELRGRTGSNETGILGQDDSLVIKSVTGNYSIYNLPQRFDTSANKVMTWDASTKKLGWSHYYGGGGGGADFSDITTETRYQNYLDKTTQSYGAFYWTNAGAGSAVLGFTTSAVPLGFTYAHSLETGTTTTGLAVHYTQQLGTYAAIALSSAIRYNIGGRVMLEDLSDGTDTYEYYLGWMDDITGSANIVDGVYFTYTHSASSGQWVCHTESNNTKTSTASGVTVAADTPYELEISVFGGSAFFYINKTLVATIATNVPDDDANRITCAGDVIIKSAGTTNRKAYVDWFAYGRQNQ